MNEPNSESTWNPSSPFEQMLEACKPAGGNQLEKMLYLAGWQAALAQVAQVAQLSQVTECVQVAQNTKRARPNRSASNSMKWFGSGLGIGLAVSLLGVILGLKFTDPVQSPALSQSGPTVEARESALSSHTDAEAFKSVNPSNDHSPEASSPKLTFDLQVNSLFAWSDLFVNFARDRDSRPPVSRAHVGRGDIDWDVLPNRNRYEEAVLQDAQPSESNDYPRSKALFYRPLREAQIKELL